MTEHLHDIAGNPEPGPIDLDGDGVPDVEFVDTDGDGVVDARLEDYDGDGVADAEFYDTDGDGRPDIVVQTAGGVQTISVDLDGDGRLEVVESFPVEDADVDAEEGGPAAGPGIQSAAERA